MATLSDSANKEEERIRHDYELYIEDVKRSAARVRRENARKEEGEVGRLRNECARAIADHSRNRG